VLELLTPEKYAELVESVATIRVDSNMFAKILVSAITDSTLKPVPIEFVKNKLVAKIFTETARYIVAKRDLEEFREWFHLAYLYPSHQPSISFVDIPKNILREVLTDNSEMLHEIVFNVP